MDQALLDKLDCLINAMANAYNVGDNQADPPIAIPDKDAAKAYIQAINNHPNKPKWVPYQLQWAERLLEAAENKEQIEKVVREELEKLAKGIRTAEWGEKNDLGKLLVQTGVLESSQLVRPVKSNSDTGKQQQQRRYQPYYQQQQQPVVKGSDWPACKHSSGVPKVGSGSEFTTPA